MQIDGFKTKAEAIEHIKKERGFTTNKEAERYLLSHLPEEKKYQGKIIRYIKKTYPGAFIWKATQGEYSTGGIPDICAVIFGKFFGFEVKRPYYGKESKLQAAAIRQIRAAGGTAEVVSYVSEVAEIIEKSLREAGDV